MAQTNLLPPDGIVTRSEAKERGLKRYFTGLQCVNGHAAERTTVDGQCTVCCKLKMRRRYRSNPEHGRALSAEWRRKNPEIAKAKLHEWRTANGAHILQYRKDHYSAHKEHIKAKALAWAKANPIACVARVAKRRTLKMRSSEHYTKDDVAHLLKIQKVKCAHPWCRKSIKGGFHVDHIIALSCGGSNGRRNIQLLCAPCNIKKRAQHPVDVARLNGMLV